MKTVLAVLLLALPLGLAAQAPPPSMPPQELDRLVGPIALYPDPLLAQVLAAATYSDQIPDAAKWADEHHYLTGQALADAIQQDALPWDPSVQAMLPFPAVLDRMASDMNWTRQLGDAFLAQPNDVMDAAQRMRRQAYDYGYLRSNNRVVVRTGPFIDIEPVDPNFMVVPYYDPLVIYAPVRPGFFVGAGIGWGYGIGLGVWFRPWGWGYTHFGWGNHAVFINNVVWGRRWDNRLAYAHPYRGLVRPGPGAARVADRHELMGRSEREKSAARFGHERVEEHRGGGASGRPHRP
jgi:hypothetical protein